MTIEKALKEVPESRKCTTADKDTKTIIDMAKKLKVVQDTFLSMLPELLLRRQHL